MPRVSDAPPDAGPILLFDGVCNLCNASVTWIIKRDRRARFRFAPLQSRFAREALAAHPRPIPDSVILLDRGRVLTRSAAAIGVARRLGLPWSLAAVFWIVPRPLRDAAYSFIAARRYRWFGKQDACMVPTPALRTRFINDPARDDAPTSS